MTEFTIIIETENLGMAGLEDLKKSLDSLKDQDFPIKKVDEVILIVGSHVSENIQSEIKSDYPWLKIHIEKNGLDYAKSKMLGANLAKNKILIFMDSDMDYESTWLTNMVNTFGYIDKGFVISGDTRLETNSAYNMALNSMWMVQVLSDKISVPTPTTFFPLNNFAISKDLMTKIPLPYHLNLYRNKIPIWEKMLLNNGNKVLRAPGTRGFHAPPGKLIDWFFRMLIYGSDFVALADYSVNSKNIIIEKKNMVGRFQKFLILLPWKIEQLLLNSYKLIKEDPKRLRFLAVSLIIGLVSIIVIQIGALIAIFNRDYMFNKINSYENSNTV